MGEKAADDGGFFPVKAFVSDTVCILIYHYTIYFSIRKWENGVLFKKSTPFFLVPQKT